MIGKLNGLAVAGGVGGFIIFGLGLVRRVVVAAATAAGTVPGLFAGAAPDQRDGHTEDNK